LVNNTFLLSQNKNICVLLAYFKILCAAKINIMAKEKIIGRKKSNIDESHLIARSSVYCGIRPPQGWEDFTNQRIL